MTAPDDMTLVIPLRAKDGMTLPDFYDYWLNAHVTVRAGRDHPRSSRCGHVQAA